MDNKLEYVKQLEDRIVSTKTTLTNLTNERERAMITVQHEEIENLEKYLAQADVSLKELSESAGDAWNEFKEAIEQLMSNISHSLNRLLGDSEEDTSGQ